MRCVQVRSVYNGQFMFTGENGLQGREHVGAIYLCVLFVVVVGYTGSNGVPIMV